MHDVSQVFYLIDEEVTLIHLESNASFAECCEDFVNMAYAFLVGVRLNDRVFYIDEESRLFEFD